MAASEGRVEHDVDRLESLREPPACVAPAPNEFLEKGAKAVGDVVEEANGPVPAFAGRQTQPTVMEVADDDSPADLCVSLVGASQHGAQPTSRRRNREGSTAGTLAGAGTGGGTDQRRLASAIGVTFDATLYARRIREFRKGLGLTQVQLADELARLSIEIHGVGCGANDRLVRSWERGEKRPGPYYQRLLCELFEAGPAELGFRAPGRDGRSPTVASLAGAEDDDVRRRTFLGALGAATLNALARDLEGVRRTFDRAVDPVDIDVDEWERGTCAYGRELATVPPAQLLPHLTADFHELVAILGVPRPDATRRRLTRVAGQLAALIAVTEATLGELQAARRWWRTARRAADHAGDPHLSAFVRGRQAVLALYGTHSPSDVLDLAEDAVAAGRGAPCTGVVSGLAARAQALAVAGQRGRAHIALGELADRFERLPAEITQERVSPFGWAAQRLHHVESYVHTRLGDTRRAGAAQDAALSLYTASNHRARAQVELHRAACLIIDGYVTDGIRHATDALQTLPYGHRTGTLVQGLARDTLAAVPDRARRLPAVAEYRELLVAADA